MRIVYGVELILLVDAFLYLSGASGSGISCYRCWGDSCQDENFEPLTSATEEGCAQCYKVKSTYESKFTFCVLWCPQSCQIIVT